MECRAQAVARDVVRVWITGEVASDDTTEVDQLLRDVEDRCSVILLDLRAAPLTSTLRALVETTDARTRMRRRRLVILEQPVPGAGSELELLGLTAKIMSLVDRSKRDGAGTSGSSSITRFERGRRIVVEVLAALDIALGPELDAELAMHAARGRSIVLDLRAVQFMDSTGIRVLIEARERARQESLGFAILPSDAVTRTLEAANLGKQFAGQPAPFDLRS
jgi:anti-sigma B factor antagonist